MFRRPPNNVPFYHQSSLGCVDPTEEFTLEASDVDILS